LSNVAEQQSVAVVQSGGDAAARDRLGDVVGDVVGQQTAPVT